MSSAGVAAALAGMTFLLTLFGVVYIGGKVARSVEDHGITLIEHSRKFEDQDKRLGTNEREIFGLKKWHEGYDARSNEKRGD